MFLTLGLTHFIYLFPFSLVCSSIFISHCADAVVLLANLLTVVGDVAPVLSSFATRWAKTPHCYDSHIAVTMPANWVNKHQPVILRHKEGHELYAKFSFGRPEGKIVLCHQRCGKEVTSRASGDIVDHKCLGCLSRCVTPKIKSDRGTTLG